MSEQWGKVMKARGGCYSSFIDNPSRRAVPRQKIGDAANHDRNMATAEKNQARAAKNKPTKNKTTLANQ